MQAEISTIWKKSLITFNAHTTYLCEVGSRLVGAEQAGLHGALHRLYYRLLVQEVHLVLGGVYVYVHVLGRNLQTSQDKTQAEKTAYWPSHPKSTAIFLYKPWRPKGFSIWNYHKCLS